MLITADTGGVLQESTKTGANRSYTLGAWIKLQPDMGNYRNLEESRGNYRGDAGVFLHLALGPGWDKEIEIREQTTGNSSGWQYYSAAFENPPPGLVPRIYIASDNQQSAINNQQSCNST